MGLITQYKFNIYNNIWSSRKEIFVLKQNIILKRDLIEDKNVMLVGALDAVEALITIKEIEGRLEEIEPEEIQPEEIDARER